MLSPGVYSSQQMVHMSSLSSLSNSKLAALTNTSASFDVFRLRFNVCGCDSHLSQITIMLKHVTQHHKHAQSKNSMLPSMTKSNIAQYSDSDISPHSLEF
jgi:hypothetical protein